MKTRIKYFSALLLSGCASVAPVNQSANQSANQGTALKAYVPVTDARLNAQEPSNWLLYRGNHSGWGYSPLAKINDGNVEKLKVAWAFSTGQVEGHQAPPIVNNGYMYVATPGSQVIALNAKTGDELWRYKAQVSAEMLQLHPTSRGVALYGDKVYLATVDCKLVALDAKTGKVLWTKVVEDYKGGYYMTLMPLAAKGKIVIGASGGELGVRGFIAAFDADTGNEKWRTYTVPGPGEPGGDSWPAGDAYKTGGGPVWVTGTFDPQTNLTYWGTGNPSPWTPDSRKGDNLYTTSALALDIETGAIKGHHQYHWNDSWDWDEVSAPVLIDTVYKGRSVKAAVHAGRDGYMWMLERSADKLSFLDAWPYVTNNVFTSIDPKTGRPTYDESRKPAMGRATEFCPGLWGGKDWPPEAYNPNTGYFYVPANNNLCAALPANEAVKYKRGDLFLGVPIEGIFSSIRIPPSESTTIGELQAWDMKTGKLAWVQKFPSSLWTPVLTTGGNLVFAGGTSDRKFRAFNAKDGKVLWEMAAPSGVIGVPVAFEVDDEQYIAVQSGWGVDAERIQGQLNKIFPDRKVAVPQGGSVMVFKLGA